MFEVLTNFNNFDRLKFSRWTSLARRSDIFGNAQNEKLAVRAGDFILSGLSVIPLYILPFGKITANQSASVMLVQSSLQIFI